MAPLPKKKHAKARTRRRKSTKKISLPNLTTCPNCGKLKYPHKACPNCGFYKDKNEEKDRPKTSSAN